MEFDPKSAKPLKGGFDPSSAIPIKGSAIPSSSTEDALTWARGKFGTEPGKTDAAALKILQGATFGFGDEMQAGMGAVDTALGNLWTRATGGTPKFTPGEAYDAMLQASQEEMGKFSAEQPKGSGFGLEMLGGAMAPGANAGAKWISEAPGFFAKLGRGAMVGAPSGAAAGFGSGHGLGNRLEGAGEGAVIGAGLGTTLPVLHAAGQYLFKLAKDAGQALPKIFGMTAQDASKLSPKEAKAYEDEALNYVRGLIEDSGHSIEDLSKDLSHVMGKPITAAETSRVLANQLASIARRGGTTGDIAETQFRLRGEDRPGRIMTDLAQVSGLEPQHVEGNMEALTDKLRNENRPLYNQAFAQFPPRMSDPQLQRIMKQPNFQSALRILKTVKENKQLPFDPENMSWEDFDTVKKLMGAVIKRKHTNGAGQFVNDPISVADLEGLGNLRDWLFKENPFYQIAVAHGGEPIKMEQAFNGAQKLMSPRVNERTFDKAINEMTPSELDATKAGWVNDVYNRLNKNRLQAKDLQSDEFLAKAKRLMGEKGARQFVDNIKQEMRLKAGEQRLPPGRQSITGELKTAQEEMDQKTDDFIEDVTDKLIRRGLVRGIALAVNRALWDVFRAAKTPEREALRNEVGKLLLLKPDQLQLKLEQHGKVVSTKAKEIMQMLQHVGYAGTGPLANAATQEAVQ